MQSPLWSYSLCAQLECLNFDILIHIELHHHHHHLLHAFILVLGVAGRQLPLQLCYASGENSSILHEFPLYNYFAQNILILCQLCNGLQFLVLFVPFIAVTLV